MLVGCIITSRATNKLSSKISWESCKPPFGYNSKGKLNPQSACQDLMNGSKTVVRMLYVCSIAAKLN